MYSLKTNWISLEAFILINTFYLNIGWALRAYIPRAHDAYNNNINNRVILLAILIIMMMTMIIKLYLFL